MNEVTTKAPLSDEQKQRRRAGRGIALAFFNASFKAQNPDATKEERKTAWKEARKAQTRIGMRALRQMERAGLAIVPAMPQAEAAE